MTYVPFSESAPDVPERAPRHRAAHNAFRRAFRENGTLRMLGPFGSPAEGAMSVFTSRAAAEAFAADSFVSGGVVARWYVRAWNDIIGG